MIIERLHLNQHLLSDQECEDCTNTYRAYLGYNAITHRAIEIYQLSWHSFLAAKLIDTIKLFLLIGCEICSSSSITTNNQLDETS